MTTSVATLHDPGWLAVDDQNLWITQDPSAPALYRMPLTGGPPVALGPVPAGPLVPLGPSLWVGSVDGLYRVPKAGGAELLVAPGDVSGIGRDGATIVVEQLRYGGRAAIRTVDASLNVTTVVPDITPSRDLVAGGGWAYVLGGVRIDLKKGEVEYAWKCMEPVFATSERVVLRCVGGTRVATHGSLQLTAIPAVPETKRLFGGPSHVCWMVGEKNDQLSCVGY